MSPALFKDRNFVTGSALGFVFGLVLFATLALMPPLLQDLLNYPVMTTGLVTAPRGAGTLIAMFIVGRIAGKVDVRLIIGLGFALAAFACWQMTGFDLQMDAGHGGMVWARARNRHRLNLRGALDRDVRDAEAVAAQRRHGDL